MLFKPLNLPLICIKSPKHHLKNPHSSFYHFIQFYYKQKKKKERKKRRCVITDTFHCHSSFDRHHYIHSDTRYPEINTKIWREDKIKVEKELSACFWHNFLVQELQNIILKWTMTISWQDRCKMSGIYGIN